jgi:NDP-sugar pyrophosphorylase family protein
MSSPKLETAVLLVGGEGARLNSVTNGVLPKPLIEVNGKPILEWSLNWLKYNGIRKVVLATGNKTEPIKEFLQSKDNFGLEAKYSPNPRDSGTGGAFKLAIDRYVPDENFVAMNGDELTNMDLKAMANKHFSQDPSITMALAPLYCPFSIAELKAKPGESARLEGFKYGHHIESLPISIGIYIFKRGIFERIPDKGSIEDELFTELAQKGEILGYMLPYGQEWTTVNDPKQLRIAANKLKAWYDK